MLETEVISQEIEAGYNPAKYQDKNMIILGVHSHDHDSVHNPTDREFYYLSRYMEENPDVVVCSTSTPGYYKKYGYKGYQYVEEHFKPVEFIGRDVWYRDEERLMGAEAVKQLHSIIQTRFSGRQVILLRPGTPYVGDAIADNLLKETDADEKYLVIDDPRAEIYKLMDRATEALNINREVVRNYVTGSMVAEADDLSDLLRPNQLSSIRSIQKMYDQGNGSEPLLMRTPDRLLQTYDSSLPIYVAAPDQDGQLTTLEEFRDLVSQDIDGHTDKHYSLVVCPSESSRRKNKIANNN